MTIARVALLSTSPSATDAVLRRVAAAMVAEFPALVLAWSPVYPEIVVPDVRIVSSARELSDDDAPFLFSPSIDDPGAEAYHFIKADASGVERPYALIWCPPEATPDEITERAMHEAVEAIPDPGCDRYDPDGFAIEVADALEGVTVYRDTPEGRVRVCAWCEPPWFKLGPPGVMYDSAGACSEAHQILPGGYGQRRAADGSVRDVGPMGEAVRLPAHKHGPHSRRSKRRRRAGRARA